MKYSKRVVYCLLGFIVTVNIIYRYPAIYIHENGFDAFLIHNLADSISYYGYAKWVLNPLSYFGMYAFSYPSAMPFLYSEFSQVTSISIELCVLITGMIFGIIGALFAYLAAKEILDSDIFAFFTSLTFSIAPFLLNLTTWEGSTKGFVVTLLPFFIFLLLKHLKTSNTKYLVIALIVLILMSSIHRIGYLAIFIFLAYLFTVPIHTFTRIIITPDLRRIKLKRFLSAMSVIGAFTVAFALLFITPGFLGSADITQQYASGRFMSGRGIFTILVNLGITYAGKTGILIPLLFLGLFAFAWQERRSVQQKFIIIATIFLIPFLPLREYMTAFFVSIFSIIIGFSIYFIFRIIKKRRKTAIAVFLILTVSSMGFSWYMKDYWHNSYWYNEMKEETYGTAMYTKNTLTRDDMFIANKGYISARVTAISGVISLPLGGASANSYNAQQMIYDNNFDIDRNSLDIKPLQLNQLGYATNEIFVFKDPGRGYDAELSWATILDHDCNSPVGKSVQMRYNIHYALETHDLDGRYLFWGQYYSAFLVSVHEQRYKIYDNSEEAMWYV